MNNKKTTTSDFKHRRISEVNKVFIIIITIAFLVVLIFLRINNLSNKYYSSPMEFAKVYFPEEDATYIQELNYCYVIIDSDNNNKVEFMYKTDEEEYILFKNLVLERFNRRRFFIYKDIVPENFYSFIHVEIHEEYCIILIERYFVNNEKVDITVYDNYEQLKPTETYSREYYFTILKLDSIEENYELRVDVGENSYYIVGTNEFNRAK